MPFSKFSVFMSDNQVSYVIWGGIKNDDVQGGNLRISLVVYCSLKGIDTKKIQNNEMRNKIDFAVKIPIYNQEVGFFLNYEKEEMPRVLARAYGKKMAETIYSQLKEPYGGITYMLGNIVFVYIPSFSIKDREGISTLVHELYHAAHRVLSYVGLQPVFESEEAYAYLMGFLMKGFYGYYADEEEYPKIRICCEEYCLEQAREAGELPPDADSLLDGLRDRQVERTKNGEVDGQDGLSSSGS